MVSDSILGEWEICKIRHPILLMDWAELGQRHIVLNLVHVVCGAFSWGFIRDSCVPKRIVGSLFADVWSYVPTLFVVWPMGGARFFQNGSLQGCSHQ